MKSGRTAQRTGKLEQNLEAMEKAALSKGSRKHITGTQWTLQGAIPRRAR